METGNKKGRISFCFQHEAYIVEKVETSRSRETKNSTLDKIAESVVVDAKGREKMEPRQRQSTEKWNQNAPNNILVPT